MYFGIMMINSPFHFSIFVYSFFLLKFIRTLERSHDFNARAKVYCASLLTVALHGKLEYYTDIMRTLLLELMEEYVHSKNPKLMLRRSVCCTQMGKLRNSLKNVGSNL